MREGRNASMEVNLNASFVGLGAKEQAWFKAGDSSSCGLRSNALIVHVLPGLSLALVDVKALRHLENFP